MITYPTLFFLMLKIYNITLSDTKYTHQIEQLSIANSTARNIESYLSELLSSKTKELTGLNNMVLLLI